MSGSHYGSQLSSAIERKRRKKGEPSAVDVLKPGKAIGQMVRAGVKKNSMQDAAIRRLQVSKRRNKQI